LSTEAADVAMLAQLAAVTNTRLAAQSDRSALAIGSDELVFDIDYSHIINAAFCYPGQGARFSDRTRGAWYAATEIDTCLDEVAYHRRVHLAETDWWHDVVDYQDYTCSIGGRGFADLRDGDPRALPYLDPDSYEPAQRLAVALLTIGAAGVVYPAVRRSGGTNVACFRPALLPPVSAGGRYRLEWSGSDQPGIRSLIS
jgi:hypothetical protein